MAKHIILKAIVNMENSLGMTLN